MSETPSEKRECVYCGRTVPKNRDSSWCSFKCVERQRRADKASDEMERDIQDNSQLGVNSMFRPTFTEQEVTDSVNALKKWRDGEVGLIVGVQNVQEYPFVIGAVPALLWAYEQLTEAPDHVVVRLV